MEKKLFAARKPPVIKSRVNLPPPSFIALGNRPATPETSSGGVKRELSSSGLASGLPLKKFRGAHDDPSSSIPFRREVVTESVWQNVAKDVSPLSVMDRINLAESKGKREKVERLICGLVKLLFDNRSKAPDPLLVSVLCHLAKEKPTYFETLSVVESFCALLAKQPGLKAISLKTHKVFYTVVANILTTAFDDRSNWPELLVKAYLDDALSDRMWVDRSECTKFVEVLENAFGTERPSLVMLASLFMAESRPPGAGDTIYSPQRVSHSPFDDHDSGGSSRDALTSEQLQNLDTSLESDLEIAVGKSVNKTKQNRFAANFETIKHYTVELLRDIWSKQRPDSLPKSLLKTMSVCCGYTEVRLAASQKIDGWLQNAKFQRVSVELMLWMALNCKEENAADIEVIQNLTRLRLKSKPMINSFCVVLKELFTQSAGYLMLILKLVIHNELSVANRGNHNMVIVGCCFQQNQQLSSQILADVCFEFLIQKDDYIRALRSLLKEIVRVALKFDFPFVHFSEALSLSKPERFTAVSRLDSLTRDRLYKNLEDMFTLVCFLGISPSIKEAAISLTRGDKKDVQVIKNYQQQFHISQMHSLTWLQSVVPIMFKPNKQDYINSLFLKIINDTPLNEEVINKLLNVGLSTSLPLTPAAAVELVEQLVKRTIVASASGKFHTDSPMLSITKLDLIDLMLSSCRYRGYEGFSLPAGYEPPLLAITVSFWRTMLCLVIFACHNPSSVGRIVWKHPTLSIMMQMIMTDDYTFPPASAEEPDFSCDDIKRKDLQAYEIERQEILELESYLTNENINESSSKILSQLMKLDLKGPARRPPQNVLDQLKTLNQSTNLGLLLCHSRDPDFLLEIIEKQGASHSLPWLVQLIQKNENSLAMLPIQCLCEFLLHQIESQQVSSDEYFDNELQSTNLFNEQRNNELRQRLRKVIWNPNSDVVQVEQTLMYFVNRLQADTSFDRLIAANALDFLIKKHESSPDESNDCLNWLENLCRLPHFENLKLKMSQIFLKCCYVETDPSFVHAYVKFLSSYMSEDLIVDSVTVLSKMICDRKAFFTLLISNERSNHVTDVQQTTFAILLMFFDTYLKNVRKPEINSVPWSSNQEQLVIQWKDLNAVINVQVVFATMILLASGKPAEFDCATYHKLMEIWFPSDVNLKPTAFLADTMEEAELFPEWLKVRLLKSSQDRIVDYVISSLEQSQIFLFLQTYGLPVKNVTKLLRYLDDIVQRKMIESFIKDPQNEKIIKTVADFVKSYKTLGANGGDCFLDFASKCNPQKSIEEMDVFQQRVKPVDSEESLHVNDTPFEGVLTESSMENFLKDLFKINVISDGSVLLKNLTSFLLTCVLSDKSEKLRIFGTVFTFIDKRFKEDGKKFIKSLNDEAEKFCLVFRSLQDVAQDLSENNRRLLRDFCFKLLNSEVDSLVKNICRSFVESQDSVSSVDVEMIDVQEIDGSLQKAVDVLPVVAIDKEDAQNVENDYFEIDILTHRLLVGFANLAEILRSEQKLEAIECILRRLATQHPDLLVRQLPLIASLLRGNTSYTMRKYYNSSYLIYFVMILDLLELLKPRVFDRRYSNAFMDIMNSFFDFIENHCLRNPKMLVIIDKVLALLQDFHVEDPETATKYLESWASLIQMISIRYPEIPNLRTLMTRVNLPLAPVCLGPSTSDTPSTSAVDNFDLKPLHFRPSSPVTIKEVETLHGRFRKSDSVEDVLSVLKDVSDLHTKKTDSLVYFRAELERLIVHRNKDCSRLAFELLMKYFRQFPGEASNFLPKFLSCFDIQNGAGKVALSFLPAFCRVYSGDPGVLLESAFSWGVRNLGKEVIPYLCEAITIIHQNCLADS